MKVMGIINCTPDSFSDGGVFFDVPSALDQVSDFLKMGVDYIDVGGQSTRPGSDPVDANEEWERIAPLLSAVKDKFDSDCLRKLSVDSFYPQIWIKAVDHYQVGMINSVVGARKKHAPELKKLFSMDPSLSFVAMHMHGEPKSMQDHPLDEIEKVRSELIDYRKNLVAAGCKPQRVWLDPGVGFGKTDSLNFRLIRRAGDIVKNENLLYGVSRKSFLDRWLGIPSPKDRDQVSKGLELGLAAAGVGMIRTHVPQPLCSARNYGVQSL